MERIKTTKKTAIKKTFRQKIKGVSCLMSFRKAFHINNESKSSLVIFWLWRLFFIWCPRKNKILISPHSFTADFFAATRSFFVFGKNLALIVRSSAAYSSRKPSFTRRFGRVKRSRQISFGFSLRGIFSASVDVGRDRII